MCNKTIHIDGFKWKLEKKSITRFESPWKIKRRLIHTRRGILLQYNHNIRINSKKYTARTLHAYIIIVTKLLTIR